MRNKRTKKAESLEAVTHTHTHTPLFKTYRKKWCTAKKERIVI